MKVLYDLDIPKSIPEIKCADEYETIKDFLCSEHKNVVFEYDSGKTAKKVKGHILALAMNDRMPIYAVVRGNRLYIERKHWKVKGEMKHE